MSIRARVVGFEMSDLLMGGPPEIRGILLAPIDPITYEDMYAEIKRMLNEEGGALMQKYEDTN